MKDNIDKIVFANFVKYFFDFIKELIKLINGPENKPNIPTPTPSPKPKPMFPWLRKKIDNIFK